MSQQFSPWLGFQLDPLNGPAAAPPPAQPQSTGFNPAWLDEPQGQSGVPPEMLAFLKKKTQEQGPPDYRTRTAPAAAPAPVSGMPPLPPGMASFMENQVNQMGPPAAYKAPDAQAQLAFAQQKEAQAAETAAAPVVPRGTTQVSGGGQTKSETSNLQQMINDLNARELDSLKQQGLTAEGLRQKLGQLEGKELPMDLTPFAALTDQWTGSNFSQTYRPQETKASRDAQVEKLRGQVLQSEQGLTQAEIAMLKNKVGMQMQQDEFGYKQSQDAKQNALEWAKIAAMKDKAQGIDPAKAFEMRTTLTKLKPAEQARGVTGFLGALNDYETAMKAYTGNPAHPSAAAVRSAYTQMSIKFKEAAALGALAGPDLDLLRQNVANGGTWQDYLFGVTKGGKGGIQAAIDQTRKSASQDFELAHKNLVDTAGPALPVVSDVLTGYRADYEKVTGKAPVAEIDAAKAWLADPANANSPDRAGVEAGLKTLGG